MMVRIISGILLVVTFVLTEASGQPPAWQAASGRENITPDEPMWMAGFAARDRPSQGKMHDLWAKALVLQDSHGRRAVLVTSDLLGFPKPLSDRIRTRLTRSLGLSKAEVILNSSHTHSAPVLADALQDIYPIDSAEVNKVKRYTKSLEDKIVGLVERTVKGLSPAKFFSNNGVVRFSVNRRNNNASALESLSELKGPSDHAVPVIKIVTPDDSLLAVVFGYACHNTTLSDYAWSGDFAGFSQLEIEKTHSGANAMFFQGAGADQNPLPRGEEAQARQYGKELAAAVENVLEGKMIEQNAELAVSYVEINLPFQKPPTPEKLQEMLESEVFYYQKWAERMLAKQKEGGKLPTNYEGFPVQAWRLGTQGLISLGGELTVDYALNLKQVFGQNTFIMGYSNDVMAYIPTAKIIREGGYEGETSQMVYGHPGSWSPQIESMILSEAIKVALQAGIKIP